MNAVLDFDILTAYQVDAMCSVAFGGAGHGFQRRTLEALAERGLIAPVEHESADRFGRFSWTDFTMPMPVHIAFCEWCSERENPAARDQGGDPSGRT